jgi:predicted DNA-binding transcriptional regulator YafY
MARARRLLDLIEILRRHRYPVTGAALADELKVSLRTLYRDIALLQGQGADIEGEPGLGYVLKPGFMLPPLMFSEDEIEALVLGSRWVADRTADERLSAAARNALAKIATVLPADLRDTVDATALLIGPGALPTAGEIGLPEIRQAIRDERKVEITYQDAQGAGSARLIWPFAVAFFEHARIVCAWCELRRDYRHFRVDRIETLVSTEDRYPRRRHMLMKEWRETLRPPPDKL